MNKNKTFLALFALIAIIFGLALTGFFYLEKVGKERASESEKESPQEIARSLDVGTDVADDGVGSQPWREFFQADTSSLDRLASSYDFGYVFDPEKLDEPGDADSPPDKTPSDPLALPDVRVPGTPALALVIDDCGFSMEYARRVVACGLRMTWAIIPNLRFSTETAELLDANGIPYLIHVPMQAYVDPDNVAGRKNTYSIGVNMSYGAVRDALLPLLDSLPAAYGINNHRGSKATSDKATMDHVMKVLSQRHLFFMDSSTSSKTVGYRTALAYGLDTVKNNYFLDNEPDRAKIKAQLDKAIEGAKKKGSAVAICHLRPDTIALLETIGSSYFANRGVRLVTLPQLVELRKGDDIVE